MAADAPRPSRVQAWLEATRPRTLPAALAAVMAGVACALAQGCFSWAPVVLCLVVALAAQIASNFANEYFDWRSGVDAPGREGFRRGVTEGDIPPAAMLRAAVGALAVACCAGLALVAWSGWWLVVAGVLVAVAVMAYSAGPWPLSRHGLGEVAVVVFFGVVPVNLTAYFMTQTWTATTLAASVGIGLVCANIMVVNNTRDLDSDRLAGKRTLAVMLGRRAMTALYALNGLAGAWLTAPLLLGLPVWVALVLLAAEGVAVARLATRLYTLRGAALNALLRATGLLLLAWSAALLLSSLALA